MPVHQLLKSVLISLRPKHWGKNLLVFALPLSDGLLIGNQSSVFSLGRGCLFFLILSFMSSANYIVNDIMDSKFDRNHPVKKHRPIASGALRTYQGLSVSLILCLVSLGLVWIFFTFEAFLCVILFGVVQFLYTLFFKKFAGYDLAILSSLYVFRAVVPVTYENVNLTKWFLVIFFSAALFLSSGKRYSEFIDDKSVHSRKVLSSYSEVQLLLWISVSIALLMTSYLSWIFSFSQSSGFEYLLVSLLPMTIFLIKTTALTVSNLGQDPTKLILRHKDTLFLGLAWLILYLKGKGYL